MRYFKEFNTPETILSVCSYPDPKHGVKELNAIAWHAEKTLKPLAHDKQKIVVIAEDLDWKSDYKDGPNMLILRVWKKFHPFSQWSILKTILKFTRVQTVLYQFEFNIFGGIWPVLFLPIILLILRMTGRRIHFELHQVILDISELSVHVNIKNPILLFVLNLGLHWFYFMIGLLADDIIVLEEDLRTRLKNIVSNDKIVFVPIAIEKQRTSSQEMAKKSLNLSPDDFCILVFGFVNWYKGSDWIVNTIKNSPKKHIRLLLAGGENPTLKDKAYYQKYYAHIEAIAKSSDKVILTGFVPDKEIKRYFSAADVVVLPYRVFMSASGPFSFALSFRKPILLSSRLYSYKHSEDFAQAMLDAKVSDNEMFFPFNQHSFNALVDHMRKNEEYASKLEDFSKDLSTKRSTEAMVKRLERILVPAYAMRGNVGLFSPTSVVPSK